MVDRFVHEEDVETVSSALMSFIETQREKAEAARDALALTRPPESLQLRDADVRFELWSDLELLADDPNKTPEAFLEQVAGLKVLR